MTPPRRFQTAIAPLLAISLLLCSCGGGSAADPTSVQTTAAKPAKPVGESSASGERGKSEYRAPETRSNVRVGSLRVTSGGVKQFSKLTNYPTLHYGEEASRSELEQAGQVIHGYLVAHMRYDWSSSCSYLNERELEEVDTLASHFEQVAGKPCPVAISYLLGTVPAAKTFATSDVQAGAFRVSGDQGYLFYRVAGAPYMMPMSREGDKWKLYSLFTGRVSPRPPTPPASSG